MNNKYFYNDSFLSSAEVDVNATGQDWMKYSEREKQRLVTLIYEHLGIDKEKYSVQKGIKALNIIFYTVSKRATGNSKNKDIGSFLKKKCVDVIRQMISKEK